MTDSFSEDHEPVLPRLRLIGRERKDIHHLVSSSDGLVRAGSMAIGEGASENNRIFLSIDARIHAADPSYWKEILKSVLKIKDDLPDHSYWDCLKTAFDLKEDCVLVVENAEDLLRLKNFSGCQSFLEIFDALNLANAAICFWWKSMLSIPPEIKGATFRFDRINSQDALVLLSNHYNSVNDSFSYIVNQVSGGYPEYLPFIAELQIQNSNYDLFERKLRRSLRTHDSSLALICRYKWLESLHLAKGYSALKSIMIILARNPGIRLSGIARAANNSAPAIADYLTELIRIGMVDRIGWAYRLRDRIFELYLKVISEPDDDINSDEGMSLKPESRQSRSLEID